MAEFDPSTATPDGFDATTAQPYEPRGALSEIGVGAKRGLFEGIQGAGAVLQAPAEKAREEPGIVSRFGQSLEAYGKEHANLPENQPQPEEHNVVTNAIANYVAPSFGAGLPVLAGAITGGVAGGAAGAPLGPIGGAVGSAVGSAIGGGSAAALQTWHDKYHEGIAKHLTDDAAREYADKSAVASGVGMGALSAIPVVGGLARTALGAGAKTAVEAGAEVAGKRFLPEFAKSARDVAVGNTALGVGGAAEQAKIDQEAGLQTPSSWEAAKAAFLPSLLGSVGFMPLSALHAIKTTSESAKIQTALANENGHPLARTRAAGAVFEAMQKADPDAAQTWAINAEQAIRDRKPIGMDSSWTDGLHPSVFPEAAPAPPKALPAPGGLSGDAAMQAGEGPDALTQQHAANAAADNAAQIYGARDAEEARQAALQPAPEAPEAVPAGLLPAPTPAIAPDVGPFSVAAQHGANNAADHAAAVEAARAQEEARLAQFASHGPLSAAAVAGVRSGAVEAAGQQRLTEIPEAKKPAKPAGTGDAAADANIRAVARNTEALPLHEAQARAAAIDAAGKDYTVVPHPSGSGYAVVPDSLLTPKTVQQYAGLQTRAEAKSSLMPFATPEIARARADALTQSTGQEHEVVPHPRAREKYAVQPKPIEVGASDAVRQPQAGEVLQRQPQQAGETGSERGRIQPGEQGQEAAHESTEATGPGESQAGGITEDHGAGLQQDEVAKLESMRAEIGWAQRGGQLVRDTKYTSSDLAADGSPLPQAGAVIGRTKWIPKSDTWPTRPDKSLSEKDAHIAIDKAVAGTILSPKEQRFIEHARHIAEEQRDYDKITPAEQDAVREGADDWSLGGRTLTREETDKWLAGEDEGAAAGATSEGDGPAGKDRAPTFGLEPQDNAGILADEAKVKAAQEAKAAADTAAENKAKADAQVGEFGLSGSDRKADVNPDQKPLLDEQPRMHGAGADVGKVGPADHTLRTATATGPLPEPLLARRAAVGQPIKNLGEHDARMVAGVLQELRRLNIPDSHLEGMTPFHAFDNGPGNAHYIPKADTIGVKQSVLNEARHNHEFARELVYKIAHELTHRIDHEGGGEFFSSDERAKVMGIGRDAEGNREPTGVIMQEAMNAFENGPRALSRMLEYPMKAWDLPDDHPIFNRDASGLLKEEVFAQLGALYRTNPRLMREWMPKSYEVFDEIHQAGKSATTVDQARSAVREALWSRDAAGNHGERAADRGNQRADAASDLDREANPRMGGEAGATVEHSGRERLDQELGNPRAAAYTPFGTKVKEHVEDFLTSQKTFNWLNQTINTQMHKAEKSDAAKRWFKPVYDKVQDYLNTANRLMMDAAEKAPDVLPQLDNVRDLLPKFMGGRGMSKDDVTKVSDAVFNGTLADKVYSAEELKAQGLNDHQAELYRQSRAAIDKSLTDTFMSEAARQAKDILPKSIIDKAVESGDPWNIVSALADRPGETKAKDAYNLLRERAAKIEELKQNGYAPLMRFGRYTVDATNEAGERSFTMHESERAANAMARALKADGMKVEQGIMSQEKWKLFQGVSPDTLELFADAVGASDKEMFQEYLARAVNNRSVLKRLMRRKGIAGFENDVQRTLAQFITSNGRAAARNYHWNDVSRLANEIPKAHGDIADEAVKLKNYIENPGDDAGAIRGALFIQFLGGSVASGIVNATQPVLMSFPYLAQYGGARKAASALLGAGKIAAGGKPTEPGLAAAMARATKEGIIAPHEVAGLYAEAIRNFGSNIGVRKALKAWGSIFALTEAFNRRITFVAAYRIAKATGEADPFAFAERAVQQTQGVYNKGNRPNIARGPVGATLFTFKQYSVAYVELLKRLPPPQRALALATLVVASGVQGVPFAQDIENVIDTIAQALGYNFNSAQKLRQWAAKTLGDSAGGFLYQGGSNIPGAPIDVSARLGVGNLIPGSGIFKRSETDKTRDVLQWFGPAGSQATALMHAFSAAQEGRYDQMLRVGMPIAAQNAWQGKQMAESGYYRDTKGRKVIETTTGEAIAKGLGFQPASVANQSEIVYQAEQNIALTKDVQTNITARWAQGIVEHDPAMIQEARAKLIEWNLKNPGTRAIITPQAVQHQVQAMLQTREMRFLKAAPKNQKGEIGKELHGQ